MPRSVQKAGGVQAGLTESFSSVNKDVEVFLKQKAVQSVKLATSSTYMVFHKDVADLLGYFTLALKMLTVKKAGLSATQEKILKRFGSFDEESEDYGSYTSC